jgi:hypothetical protein
MWNFTVWSLIPRRSAMPLFRQPFGEQFEDLELTVSEGFFKDAIAIAILLRIPDLESRFPNPGLRRRHDDVGVETGAASLDDRVELTDDLDRSCLEIPAQAVTNARRADEDRAHSPVRTLAHGHGYIDRCIATQHLEVSLMSNCLSRKQIVQILG